MVETEKMGWLRNSNVVELKRSVFNWVYQMWKTRIWDNDKVSVLELMETGTGKGESEREEIFL